MKGVLGQSRGSYLQRLQSPQPESKMLITLPEFDRGRRKISKMGGIATMFSASRVKERSDSSKKVIQKPIGHNRRFTSVSPNPKMRVAAQITKKMTYNMNKLNALDKVTSNVSWVETTLFNISCF